MDRGAWQAALHRVTWSQTGLKKQHAHRKELIEKKFNAPSFYYIIIGKTKYIIIWKFLNTGFT